MSKQYSTGYIPHHTELSLEEREQRSTEYQQHLVAPKAVSLPPQVDWRDMKGKSFVPPVRDQKTCNTCVSFATIATVESRLRILKQIPVEATVQSASLLQRSESSIYFCSAGSGDNVLQRPDSTYSEGICSGNTCKSGWNYMSAFNTCRTHGVFPEFYYPYKDKDQSCLVSRCPEELITKVNKTKCLSGTDEIKAWLAEKGPVASALNIYTNFDAAYDGLSYDEKKTYVFDADIAYKPKEYNGHAVCIVGYDDHLQAWIVKNSWGKNWGDEGYFRIRYGACGIDAEAWGIEDFEQSGQLQFEDMTAVSWHHHDHSVLMRGNDGFLYEYHYSMVTNYTQLERLEPPIQDDGEFVRLNKISATRFMENKYAVFGTGIDENLYYKIWDRDAKESWSDWQLIYGPEKKPSWSAVARYERVASYSPRDGYIELFSDAGEDDIIPYFPLKYDEDKGLVPSESSKYLLANDSVLDYKGIHCLFAFSYREEQRVVYAVGRENVARQLFTNNPQTWFVLDWQNMQDANPRTPNYYFEMVKAAYHHGTNEVYAFGMTTGHGFRSRYWRGPNVSYAWTDWYVDENAPENIVNFTPVSFNGVSEEPYFMLYAYDSENNLHIRHSFGKWKPAPLENLRGFPKGQGRQDYP